jgi:hypothetical protein
MTLSLFNLWIYLVVGYAIIWAAMITLRILVRAQETRLWK